MYTRLDNEQVAASLMDLSDKIKKEMFTSTKTSYDAMENDQPIVAGEIVIQRDPELLRLPEGMIFALCAGTRELRHVHCIDDRDDGTVAIAFQAPS